MNPETQALIDRIANGTSTEKDAEKVKAFVEAYDDWCVRPCDDTRDELHQSRKDVK